MPKKTKKNKKPIKKTKLTKMEGKRIPCIKIKTRVKDEKVKKNPYKWKTLKTKNMFKNKKIVVFSLPGAFTPTCSSSHLPDFDQKYNQ